MKKICIYGKGGIGKSTTVTNVAAAMADMGLKVAVIGCDPKGDTTRCLAGRRIPSVLSLARMESDAEFAVRGYRDILCIESGGPEPGTGCAGRGIVAALEAIRSRNLLADMDVILYDVLGDVVCGGFSMPLREDIADSVYLVTTADFMAIYAANNICRGIARYAAGGSVRLAGVIYNGRSVRSEAAIAEEFARRAGTKITGRIPMSPLISQAELDRKTVIEKYPEEQISTCFRNLAECMLNNEKGCIPKYMDEEEVEELCRY